MTTSRLALAGDTMLGRDVAARLEAADPTSLVAPEVAELMRNADITLVNLECCISERGQPYRLPGKPFFFRAPPQATELLAHLGVDCVTLANNHALDFGEVALLDTFDHLAAAGIGWAGAGPDMMQAQAPTVLPAGDLELSVVAFTDHPSAYAAMPGRPGVAYVDLDHGVDPWVTEAVAAHRADRNHVVVVSPHWGPNMVPQPLGPAVAAAVRLVEAGATLVAGHSAHVFQGVAGRVLYDLGDFLDDYRVDPLLRNDLGLLFLVDIASDGPRRLEAVPLELRHCHTVLARGDDARWIRRRFHHACRALGQDVTDEDGHPVITWPSPATTSS